MDERVLSNQEPREPLMYGFSKYIHITRIFQDCPGGGVYFAALELQKQSLLIIVGDGRRRIAYLKK
jgi:hypothetical protein